MDDNDSLSEATSNSDPLAVFAKSQPDRLAGPAALALPDRRQSFGDWLRAKRRASGMSQKRAAELGGLSPNTWSLLETAGTSPSIDTVPKIIAALNTDPNDTYKRAGYVFPEGTGQEWANTNDNPPLHNGQELVDLLRANLALYKGVNHTDASSEASDNQYAADSRLYETLLRIEARLARIEVALRLAPYVNEGSQHV